MVNFLSNALKFSHEGSKIIVELRINEVIEVERHQKRPADSKFKSMLLDDNSSHYVNYDVIVKDFGCGMS